MKSLAAILVVGDFFVSVLVNNMITRKEYE